MNQIVDAVVTLSTLCQGKLHFSRRAGKSLTESLLEQMGEIAASLTEEEQGRFNRALEVIAAYAYRRDDRWGDVCFSHLLRLAKNLDAQRTNRIETVTAVLVRQAELTASRVVAQSCRREIAFADLNNEDSTSEWVEWGAADTTDILDTVGTIKIGVNSKRIPLSTFAETIWNACRDPDVAEIVRERCKHGMPAEFELFHPVVILHQKRRWTTHRFDMIVWPGQRTTDRVHFVFVPDYGRGVRGVLLTNQKLPSIPSVVVHSGWHGGGSVMIVNKRILSQIAQTDHLTPCPNAHENSSLRVVATRAKDAASG